MGSAAGTDQLWALSLFPFLFCGGQEAVVGGGESFIDGWLAFLDLQLLYIPKFTEVEREQFF